jgi:hypothetical protein
MKTRKEQDVETESTKTNLRARMVGLRIELPNDMATATATHARLIAEYKAALDTVIKAQTADTVRGMKAAAEKVAATMNRCASGEFNVPF